MPSTITVALAQDVVEMIRARVAAGEYASESDVIRDGLRTLEAREAAFTHWLREDVAKSFDEYEADPRIAIPASQVSASLDERAKKAEIAES